MRKFILLFICCIPLKEIAQTTLLQENFTTYLGTIATVPAGWNFSYNGNYTSATFSGPSGPNSYKFGVSGATIISPSFTNADSLSFWIKGSATDALSSLTVSESADSITWTTVSTIVPLPTVGTTVTFHLLGTSKHIRFSYFKSAGNLAFDDFLVKRNAAGGSSTGNIKIYFNNPVNNSVSTGVNAVYLNNSIDDTLIAYINRAKYTMDIAVYNYVQTAAISNIANAVNAAYARGVAVRWIYDGTASNSGLALVNSSINRLPSPTTSAYNIMHNKFLVIDANSANPADPIVWTGSTNWDAEQMNSDVNNVIIIQDKNLALCYTTEFNEMWGSTTLVPNTTASKFGPYKLDNTPHIFTIGGITVEQYFSPSDGTNSKILNAISSANTDLYFGVYTFTDNQDADSIKSKITHGIYTRGIMDNNSTSFAAYATLNPVMGSTLKIYSGSFLYHSKMLIVDPCNAASDPLVLTGSHNWTAAAETKNDENTLIIHDGTTANIYYQSFNQNFVDLGGSLSPQCIATSVDENQNENSVSVYPNPNKGQFTFSNIEKESTIEIYDIFGKKIFQTIVSNDLPVIDISEKAKGIYFYRVIMKNNKINVGKICVE
ncbi:MAG: phospholipase D-like domain-containing protein [Bacteroidia bacterium]